MTKEAPKQEQGEPVAWRFKTGTFWNREPHWRYVFSLEGTEGLQGLEPLYITPQTKEWVSLTDEEIEKEWFKTFSPEPGIGKNVTNGIYEFANAILRKAQSK